MTTRALVAGAPRRLLSRLLDSPHLAQLVQALDPKVLGALVRHCGLEDCGEIVALATMEQLTRIFDDDLWRSDTPGTDEELDADRFGVWLEVLAEVGVDVAAGKLVDLDFDLVTAALSRHLLVLDQEMLMHTQGAGDLGIGGDEHWSDPIIERALESGAGYDVSGYTVVARRGDSWDALLAVLTALDHDHHAFLGRLLKRCCQISTEYVLDNGGLFDVLTADQQILDDAAGARDERREQQGYVTTSRATAFLKTARQEPAGDARDPITVAYFRDLESRAKTNAKPAAEEPTPAPQPEGLDRQVTDFLASLEAEVLRPPRRELLPAGPTDGGDRLSLIRAQLQFVQDHDDEAYPRRTEELGYLANVLVAGCSFQSRRFRAVEAADAVLAACNLGLETLAARASHSLPADFLSAQDLVPVFRAGWRILYQDVCVFTATRLVDVLSNQRFDDRELRAQISDLLARMRTELKAGTPWREAENLDVVAALDMPSWSILVNLIAECPVVPKGAGMTNAGPLLRVSREFDFISEQRQVAWVKDFVDSLPASLAGA